MTLVAGMMPEELKDDAAADHIRSVQLHLMQQLAHQHPQAMFYSNYYCWGMLHEVGVRYSMHHMHVWLSEATEYIS